MQVVDHDALSQKSARTQRALEIVDDATKTEKKAVVEKGEEEEEPRRSIPPGELV